MTITRNLEPEIEQGLLAQATTRGVFAIDPKTELMSQPRTGQDLIDASARISGLLAAEEIATLFSRNPSFARPVDFE